MQVKILGENIAQNILSSGASIIVDELKTSKL